MPEQIIRLTKHLKCVMPVEKIAYHLHDTHRRALVNILMALNEGVRTFDSSVAGIGGCNFANKATGNVATDDVVDMVHSIGYKTGINLKILKDITKWIKTDMYVEPQSLTSMIDDE